METTPPNDGWLRIENELNHRSRMTRRFWLAAASFALVLSVAATVVYIQTNAVMDKDTTTAVLEKGLQQYKQQLPTINNGDSATQLEEEQPIVLQGENNTPQGEAPMGTATATSPASVDPTALRNEDDIVIPGTAETQSVSTIPESAVAVSDIREDTEIASDIPVYVDSWDEILRMQPIKANRLGMMSNKLARPKWEVSGEKTEEPIVVAMPSMPVYDDIAYVDATNVSTKSQPRNRWEITGQFAPMYSYRAISSVPDGTNKSDFDDAESPLLAYSGGITVAYRIFNRLSVQTGVFYSQMGQSINSVTPVPNMYITLSSNNAYTKNFVNTSTGSVTVASNVKSDANTTYASYFNAESQSVPANTVAATNVSSPSKYRLIERIDYLEIPVMLHYKIIDRKLNFYVLGGISTNVLISNNVFVDNGSELVKGGSILMARPVNYSSTLGLGVGYQITGNLSVDFEPSFKYYLQSYTTNSQIISNPYSFGLFTGIIYRF
ncbi:MAG: PorT family protein [Bacteroidales bacterium]|nr:PorT family protein [Bacteroidales bacterium]